MNTLVVKKEKQLHTSALIETLGHTFLTYSQKDVIEKHPAVFLKGQPGVGKSQAVYKIANILEEKTSKKVNVIDVRLLMFNPVDLRGIPVADKEKQAAVWLRPYIFQLSEEKDVINLLFLDELTSAPQSIQAAAYQISLDRRIGEHHLPDNTFIVAAGNRQEDDALTYDMPSALKNRFMHFEVVVDLKHWMIWAKKAGIHEEIITFIDANPHYFVSETFDTPSNIIITPRTWEMLSNMVKTLGGTMRDNEVYVASFIGEHLAHLFLNVSLGISLEDILNKKIDATSLDMEMVQKIVQVLEVSKNQYINDQHHLNTVFELLLHLPKDFSIRVFKQIIKIKPKGFKYIDLQSYQDYIKTLEELHT